MQNAGTPSQDPAFTQAHDAHFTRKLKSALLAAAVVLAAAIAGLAVGISKGHDQLAHDTSQRMVEGAFKGLEDRVLSLTRDHALRDGFHHAILAKDEDWIFANAAARDGTEADISIIVDPHGRVDFGWRSDTETRAPRAGLVPPETMALLHEQLDATPVTAREAHGSLARIGDEIWQLGMSRVVPWEGIAPDTPDSAIPRLVMGKRLSPELLAGIGAPFLIHDLALGAQRVPGQASFALRDARGEILGHVSWTAPRPGWRVLANIGAPVAVVTLVTVFILIVAAFHIVGSAARLERALIRAREANRAKARFLATVSHELRTPVTSIIGALDLIGSGALADSPRKTSDIVAIAKTNSKRLAALIEDLLQIQKMESGTFDYQFEPVQLGPAIERAIRLTRPIADHAGVGIVAPGTGTEFCVRADPSRLEQVFTNILSNAVKFSHPGGEVRVDIAPTPAGVRISVTDHGVGIPAGARDEVFAPFGQVDSSDTRNAGGTGLGLNIAKRIIEAHRGVIDYRSEAGVGTTIFIELARAQAPVGEMRAPGEWATAPAGRTAPMAPPAATGADTEVAAVARTGSLS